MKASTLGGGGGGGRHVLTNISYDFDQVVQIFSKNVVDLLSQTLTKFFRVLPSILSKYQFHFDQLWANISSILTNFDQRLNY